ncbi:hypothetical protein Tcan_08736 [Toxocara canis]|uniref:Reverse transcriptase domain-containing protein n=1 Tax=Toxocara canis TaxID=6265 RepID=A0A0B2V5X4_TOXCA|nr:hypothetical protein Tcan_08736 [Toxocara canis]
MENSNLTYVVQLGIQEAYDTANIHILQKTIDRVNPDKKRAKLLQSYMLRKKIRTLGEDGIVKAKQVLIGIVQGVTFPAVPSAFVISGVGEVQTHGKIMLFADDVQLQHTHEEREKPKM